MNRKLSLFILPAVVLMGGCIVSSLNPLYTDQDLVFEPALIGAWHDEDVTWIFEKAGEKSYRVTWTGEDEEAAFEGNLCLLGKMLFLDLYPESPHPGEDVFMIPTHTFARVELKEDRLLIGALGQDWMEKKLLSREIQMAYAVVEKRVILTGSTEELQAFARKYGNDEGAFGDPLTLVRKKATLENPRP